jgi:hypothetical protein
MSCGRRPSRGAAKSPSTLRALRRDVARRPSLPRDRLRSLGKARVGRHRRVHRRHVPLESAPRPRSPTAARTPDPTCAKPCRPRGPSPRSRLYPDAEPAARPQADAIAPTASRGRSTATIDRTRARWRSRPPRTTSRPALSVMHKVHAEGVPTRALAACHSWAGGRPRSSTSEPTLAAIKRRASSSRASCATTAHS